jgi:hypothetical protein
MKITLRKIKSSPLGEGYDYDFFTPLQLENRDTVVSFTLNSHSSQYFNILRKYGIEIGKVYDHEYNVRAKKKVILEIGTTNFLLVPPTFASNKAKITVYAQEVAAVFRRFNFVHFTHFGFLRMEFPKAQIKKILDVFFNEKKLNCEICWDIDEKFHEQMKELLELFFKEHQKNEVVETYDASSFVWDESYIQERKKLIAEARELARLEWENSTSINSTENLHGNHMTFANIEISSGASGTAGEYYALSFLIRAGMIACLAPAGTANYDMLVMNRNADAFIPIQVKTIRNLNRWLLSGSHENGDSNLIFCFVKFTDIMSGTRIFFVPANVVSEAITISNQIYLALPGQHGIQRNGSNRRTLEQDFSILTNNIENPSDYLNRSQIEFLNEHRMGWLDKYENNFNIFNA